MSELLHYGDHQQFHDIVTPDGDVLPIAAASQQEIDDSAVQLGNERNSKRQTSHSDVRSFATRAIANRPRVTDPTYGQEVHVIGSDDGGETPGQLATGEDRGRIVRQLHQDSDMTRVLAVAQERIIRRKYAHESTAMVEQRIRSFRQDHGILD